MKILLLIFLVLLGGLAGATLSLWLSSSLNFKEGGGGPGAVAIFYSIVLAAGFITGIVISFFALRRRVLR